MVEFLLATCFLGLLAIAGTACMIGGHARYHGRSAGLWIVAFVWLVAVASGCRESTQPKGMNVGVLVVHRTLWDRLLLRHRALDPSAEQTFEIGASGTRFRNTRLFGRQKLVFAMQNNKLTVSADICDKFGKTIAVIEDGRLRTMDHNADFNYGDDALEIKNASGRIVLQIRLLPDRVQVQGEFWNVAEGRGVRIGARRNPKTGKFSEAGAFIKFLDLKFDPDEPHIEPLFLYPGKLNIGRYAKRFEKLRTANVKQQLYRSIAS